MEEYPSPAEGIGLENRQGVKAAGVRIPLPPPLWINQVILKSITFFYIYNIGNN